MSGHIERVRDALEAAGIEVNEVRPLPNGLGSQLRCATGAVVVVYNTGKIVPQGKGVDAVKEALRGSEGAVKGSKLPPAQRLVPPSLPIEPLPRPVAGGPLKLWTNEPWDGVTLPWDPI